MNNLNLLLIMIIIHVLNLVCKQTKKKKQKNQGKNFDSHLISSQFPGNSNLSSISFPKLIKFHVLAVIPCVWDVFTAVLLVSSIVVPIKLTKQRKTDQNNSKSMQKHKKILWNIPFWKNSESVAPYPGTIEQHIKHSI